MISLAFAKALVYSDVVHCYTLVYYNFYTESFKAEDAGISCVGREQAFVSCVTVTNVNGTR